MDVVKRNSLITKMDAQKNKLSRLVAKVLENTCWLVTLRTKALLDFF